MKKKDIREFRAKREKVAFAMLRGQRASAVKIKQTLRRLSRETNQQIRDALERSKAQAYTDQAEVLEDDLRVICFSALAPEKHDEILMWSHYTNGHRGGRIGFEIPEPELGPTSLRPMNYAETRIVLNITDCGLPNGQELVRKALLESTERKSERWEYEDEYRIFTGDDRCVRDGGLEFFPFDESWVRRVDLGLRFPPGEKQKTLGLLRSEYPTVECYQADYHSTDYALMYFPVA